MERFHKCAQKGYIIKEELPEELKKFITNYYKSPSAYIREVFNKVILHSSTIRRWYKSVNAGPSYVKEAYTFMKERCKDKKEPVCLSLDDNHIMKKLEKCGCVVTGGVDMGTRDNSEELAKMALTLMIHSVEEKWKISPGYFFHAGLKANEQKDIVLQAIVRAWESSVVVVNITADGKLLYTIILKSYNLSFYFRGTKKYCNI